MDVASLVREYEAGSTLSALSRRYPLSRGAIRKRLAGVGVTIRRDHRGQYGAQNGRWTTEPTANASRIRARSAFTEPEPCLVCGSDKNPHRHHRDHCPTNNAATNIAWLCASCHSRYHKAAELVRFVEGTHG